MSNGASEHILEYTKVTMPDGEEILAYRDYVGENRTYDQRLRDGFEMLTKDYQVIK